MSICSMFSSNRAWKILEVVATQDSFLQFIREKGRITGKLHLVLRDGRHFLESEEATLLTHLCNAVRGVGSRAMRYILSQRSGKFTKHWNI